MSATLQPTFKTVTIDLETKTIEVRGVGVQGPPGSGGGSGVWGTITGTLSDQTDLQAALDLKADAVDIVTDHTGLTSIGTNTHAQIDSHIASNANPHAVTKAQVGLSNADNTSDLDKPVSTATQTALNGKANTNLGNLASTAVNVNLLPAGDTTESLGSTTKNWGNLFAAVIRFASGEVLLDIANRLVKYTSGNTAWNVDSGELNSLDETLAVDLQNRRLIDSVGDRSLDFETRELYTQGSAASVQYGTSRALIDANGFQSVSWGDRTLIDDSEVLALTYIDRGLVAIDGATTNLDWSNPAGVTSITQSPNNNSTRLATTAYVDAQPKTLVEIFLASGTWTKPANALKVHVFMAGGGGGGGSGRKGAAATVRCGGGSGVGPCFASATFLASDLAGTESVTVGAAGAGGASQTTADTNGLVGGAGGASSFGTCLRTNTSAGGGGGTATNGTGGVAQIADTSPFNTLQRSGRSASATGATGASGLSETSVFPSSGGAGGGVNTGNSAGNGGSGGGYSSQSVLNTTAGGTAGSQGNPGNPGGNGNLTGVKIFGVEIGTSGGGGGGSSTGNGGAGGNAVGIGGSGGGGGACSNSGNSGAGGMGSDGAVVVITEF